jgi:Holliday junction DNA helicase RuvA
MIGLLQGVIAYTDDSSVIVDVHGVGYKVLVPTPILAKFQGESEAVKLFTHTHVREDLLELYGFTEPEDLKLFQYLISVSGVGCKTALTVFAVGQRKDIVRAITQGDVSFFTSVPRLGKKNAQKIIIELKSKLGDKTDIDLSKDSDQDTEVIAALKSFGFTTGEAQAAIRELKGEGETVEQKIRMALKFLGK